MENTAREGLPKFNNTQNKMYHTKDGVVWISRSVAVVAHVWAEVGGKIYVLLGKRGQKGDARGLWNVPCGYMDWDENLQQAMYREVWEETGIDLRDRKTLLRFDDQPWKVYTEPIENRQNVALHTGMFIGVGELPKTSLANMEKGEVELAEWIEWQDACQIPREEWAFNHYDRVREFFELVKKSLNG